MKTFAFRKQVNPYYFLIQKIILSCISFIMGCVAFFASDPSFLPVAIIGTLFILIGLLLIFFGIKNFISDLKLIYLPSDVLRKSNDQLGIIYDRDNVVYINFIDIIKVKSRRCLNFTFIPYLENYGTIKIKTNNKRYTIRNVDNVKDAEKWINGYIYSERRNKNLDISNY